MGEIHELFVLALSLVWFAGATPDYSYISFFFRGTNYYSIQFEQVKCTLSGSYTVAVLGN